MSDNMRIYNAVRAVPEEAKRAITAGRLKGKTDINPMWRIKALTEQFGPCGDGWGYTIDRLWIEEGAKGEKCAFAMISLWYKREDGTTDKLKTGRVMVSVKRNPPSTVVDDALLPSTYKVAKITYQPNKDLIKRELLAGGEVPGARLEYGRSVVIK